MTFSARDVMESASITLVDTLFTRWPMPELLGYINDGLIEISGLKPNACSATVTLELARGTLQRLPNAYTVLSRVTRNVTVAHTAPGGPVGGDVIRPLKDTSSLDLYMPRWQSDENLFAAKVKHVIYDLADPRQFYVAPGNDGSGMIEAVVGVTPEAIPTPGTPNDIASYSAVIPLRDVYKPILQDYVCFRAFSKDAGIPASEARAAKHLDLFRGAMAALAQGEATMALSTKQG